MAKIDAKLHSKGLGGETITTTIGYISPNATNTEIKTFAQMLNGITNNVYDNTDKVTTVNCDTEDDKTSPTLKLMRADDTDVSDTLTAGGTNYYLYYDGNGEVYYNFKPYRNSFTVEGSTGGGTQTRKFQFPMTGTFTLVSTETATNKSRTKTYTITE